MIASSTSLCSSIVWPVCFSISAPIDSTTARVELDRARHRHLEALVLLAQSSSKRLRIRKRAGIRCFSASSSRKLTSSGLGAGDRLRDPVPLLRRGEVGAEEEDLQVAVARRPRRRTRRAARGPRRARPSPWRRRTAPRRRRGRSPPSVPQPRSVVSPASAEKSTSASASSTSRFWSSRVERLAGRPSRSRARSGRRPPCGSAPASAGSRPRCRVRAAATSSSRFALPSSAASAFARLGGLAGAGDDVVGLLAGLLEALAVLGEQLVGLGALALGLPRCSSRSSRRAPRAPPRSAGTRTCSSTNIVTPKASSVQIISPRPGWTRKLPPSSSLALGRPRRGRR